MGDRNFSSRFQGGTHDVNEWETRNRIRSRDPSLTLFNEKMAGTAWRTKPTWYIVAKNDRTVDPALERFVAKRMGADLTEVESSHVPMLSQPKVVTEVILRAAKSVAESALAAV